MNTSSTLIDALESMTDRIADPAVDLSGLLADLVGVAADSIGSLLSASLTVTIEDYPFTLMSAVANTTARVRTSVSIPLGMDADEAACSELVLLAASQGSFEDLAADVGVLLHLDPAAVELDAHLSGTRDCGSPEPRWSIDRARGVLLARGVVDADLELRRRSKRERCTLTESAQHVLAAARRPTGPER
ncbi:hypothetical protein CH254_11300 [Rhodococcus sp. 06-412-2C]|uniref:hypothetical protein n=1 Tax=unclassified Rhodococcus (in: high G+C Gram-positive bacteria) TaxID=192944 RepID=UPI000B9A3D06|nr:MULTISPECIES: hypothetical protein [unclassified Rhodococcus (in: high G+C Gram-positive bacteria)]OZC88499.1 hypothetical protein CH254_11300 [Rhodococcus sp. 06-412-2C]OZC90186.1 hypothetical protein CH279_29585 [Rhodococcus sp. 06-412-2B]